MEGVPCEGTLLSFLLIDSSKTRDCQVNMSFEETSLSDRSATFLKNKGTDYLLEVFRPWDCYEQKWGNTNTAQLRFETSDLLVGRDPNQNARSRVWNVLSGYEGVHQGSSEGLAGECVCWLVDDSLVEEPGIHGHVIDLTLDVLQALDRKSLP